MRERVGGGRGKGVEVLGQGFEPGVRSAAG